MYSFINVKELDFTGCDPAHVISGSCCWTTSARQHARVPQVTSNQRPSTLNCTERWQAVDADHFGFGSVGSGHELTFNIRFFTYQSYWGGPGFPIWFYAGNEVSSGCELFELAFYICCSLLFTKHF